MLSIIRGAADFPMTDPSPYLSVVIPLKNEEGNVAPLLDELREAIRNLGTFEIIAVDDGSTDATWRILEEQKARIPELRLVRLDRNYGQSAGFWAGLKRARGRVLVTMDGDMQNDPHDIPLLLAELQKGADVCLTYRANRQDTRFKKIQSRIGNGFRNWLLGSNVIDTGSQLRAYYARCLEDLTPFNGMHRFMGNLFLMRGYKVAQVPTNHRGRRSGTTKYGMANRAFRGLRDVLGMRWLRDRLIQVGVKEESK
jgi:dolichol-phosphate mannosyltransferase